VERPLEDTRNRYSAGSDAARPAMPDFLSRTPPARGGIGQAGSCFLVNAMFLLVLAVGGKHIAGAANRADDARMVRIGLDLPPDAGDSHVDGAVERVRVAGVQTR
jgi:hypothetical protein